MTKRQKFQSLIDQGFPGPSALCSVDLGRDIEKISIDDFSKWAEDLVVKYPIQENILHDDWFKNVSMILLDSLEEGMVETYEQD
jgi:hypothetical protein